MKFIQQKHRTGCGIACVAMISNRSYQEVYDYFFPEGKRQNHYTTRDQIKAALNHFGCGHSGRFQVGPKSWEQMQYDSIVVVDKEENYWHWVVYHSEEQLVYDPERRKPVRKSQRTISSLLKVRFAAS